MILSGARSCFTQKVNGYLCAIPWRQISASRGIWVIGSLKLKGAADFPFLPLWMNDLDDPRSPHHGLHPSRLQDLRTFWITQLSGLGPLDWRSDRPRPASTSAQSASITFSIAAERLVCFETLCASANASLQTGLLALVALLLQRTSRQDDLAIAIPVWSGHPSEQEGLIGCTSNTLPIRTRFTTPQTFHQLLAQIREVSHAAYAQWDLPFAQIMELLSCEHNSNGTCLVQVIVHAIEDRNLTSQKQQRRIRKFDLEFCWQHDAAGGLSGELIYASDLFDMDRMQRAIQWLQTLLDSVLEATDSPIASLNLLPEPERRRIESWQQGPRATPSTAGVHHRFEHQADTTPEAIALIFQNEAISYGELNHRANQLSHQLIALGAAPGEIVAVCLERSVDLIVAPCWPVSKREPPTWRSIPLGLCRGGNSCWEMSAAPCCSSQRARSSSRLRARPSRFPATRPWPMSP